jgi:hypothetical protein
MEKVKIKFILTSFRDEKKWEGLKFSMSPIYPEDKEYGVAKPLEVPMKIWEIGDLDKSIDEYEIFLKNNRVSAELALEMFIKNQQDVVLCCWCHSDKTHEKISCHRESLGKFISKYVGTRAEVLVEDIQYNKKDKKEEIVEKKGEDKQRRVSRGEKASQQVLP